jgi:L-aspartate oxidase
VPDGVEPELDEARGSLVDGVHRPEVRAAMSRHVGVHRDAESLASAAAVLDAVAGKSDAAVAPCRAAWESTNLLTVASAVVLAAGTRTESRGCHRRTDHPEARDEWLRHLDVSLDADGRVEIA